MSYTKGPWRLKTYPLNYRIETYSGMAVCVCYSLGDANLFAAAPELYEALKQMAEYFDPIVDEATWVDARNALAKAEGKS